MPISQCLPVFLYIDWMLFIVWISTDVNCRIIIADIIMLITYHGVKGWENYSDYHTEHILI